MRWVHFSIDLSWQFTKAQGKPYFYWFLLHSSSTTAVERVRSKAWSPADYVFRAEGVIHSVLISVWLLSSSDYFDAWFACQQKNPGTIRTPEEDKGRENFTMDLFVNVGKSGVISRHISSLCGEAGDATYTREADIKMWASQPGEFTRQTSIMQGHICSKNTLWFDTSMLMRNSGGFINVIMCHRQKLFVISVAPCFQRCFYPCICMCVIWKYFRICQINIVFRTKKTGCIKQAQRICTRSVR